jgi:hypothetical protein
VFQGVSKSSCTIIPTYVHLFRSKQLYLANIFEDEAADKLREVPDEDTKPYYYARKTCNYLTAVLEVL